MIPSIVNSSEHNCGAATVCTDLLDECSSIQIQFFRITKQVQGLLKKPVLLLDNCCKLLASRTHAIPLFTEDELKCFSQCDSAMSFQNLSPFWTWSDHSVLRELLALGSCTEALKLLDIFDKYLVCFKNVSITSFPLPLNMSSRIIPADTNTHTVLFIKYLKCPFESTLNDVLEVRELIMKTCEVTRNSLQLLGVAQSIFDCTILYWKIPKCVVPLLNAKITENFNCFFKPSHVAEIGIYPGILFVTSCNCSVIAPFSLLTSSKVRVSCVYYCL